jgi:hypothetical protein
MVLERLCRAVATNVAKAGWAHQLNQQVTAKQKTGVCRDVVQSVVVKTDSQARVGSSWFKGDVLKSGQLNARY